MARAHSILQLDDRDYELVPLKSKPSKASQLRKFNDKQLLGMAEYEYAPLGGSKKKIRLLQLKSGSMDNPDIYCELVEANYDNIFHMPMVPLKDESESQAEPEDDDFDANVELYRSLEPRRIEYEALSWCWGNGDPEYAVLVTKKEGHQGWKEETYKKRVSKELALALKYLRHPNQQRTLWIDAICIDQKDASERNHQVQMMSRVYTRAKQVCIWLGDGDDSSKLAIDFIRRDIMELRNFDALSNDRRYNDKWKALMMLMQRKWFSRRWVVQEIALAKKATIYCGPDKLSWKQFAIAVELFVEVETATHRLSEIMQKDEKFRHIPGWFEYVSELGASLLVQATGKVFRAQRSPLDGEEDEDDEDTDQGGESDQGGDADDEVHKRKNHRNKDTSTTPGSEMISLKERLARDKTIDPLDRRSLLSLEYLVSTMFIFKASEPRDTIYAMLAISRDAAPFASSAETITDHHDSKTRLIMTACEPFLEEKPFTVDYRRPYADVCKDFVQFVIERKASLDPSQALDILCRPWALEPQPGKSARLQEESPRKKINEDKTNWVARNPEERPWTKRKRDPDDDGKLKLRYLPGNGELDKRSTAEYWKDVLQAEESDQWKRKKLRFFPKPLDGQGEDASSGGAQGEANGDVEESNPSTRQKNEQELPLPTWVSRASRGPISLDFSPGIDIQKTGRANADPLVGQPLDGHRNYSAAQTQKMKPFKFRRRPQMGHYSLYVQGFELDEVKEVLDASQGGNIPKSWLDLAGWENYTEQDPPGELWRTLVADRGRDNRNPPYYYARACRESAIKGGIASGRIDTAALINNERNSIIAEFCRRVHAVIWNRRLFRTKSGRLGLATHVNKGDKICILYGCTVPVVLQKQPHNGKVKEERKKEREEDRVETLKRVILKLTRKRQVKKQHDKKVNEKTYTKAEIDFIKKHTKEANKKMKDHGRMFQHLSQGKRRQVDDFLDDSERTDDEVDKLPLGGWSKLRNLREGGEEQQPTETGDADGRGRQPPSTMPDTPAAEIPPSKRLQTVRYQARVSPTNTPIEGTPPTIGRQAGVVLAESPMPVQSPINNITVGASPAGKASQHAASPEKIKPIRGPDGFKRSTTGFKRKEALAKREAVRFWYNFRGECYLHGMMDGEAIRQRLYEEVVDQVFELR